MTVQQKLCQTAVCMVMVVLPLVAHDAQSEIRARIETLQRSLRDQPVSGAEFEGAKSHSEELLKQATTALEAGRPYLSLEKLAQVTDFLAGARMASEKAETVKSVAAFESEWSKANATLTALDKDLRTKTWNDQPAAIRVLRIKVLASTGKRAC